MVQVGRLDERSDISTDVFLTASTSIHRPNCLTKNPYVFMKPRLCLKKLFLVFKGLNLFFEGPDISKSGCLSFVGALVFVRVQFYVGIY